MAITNPKIGIIGAGRVGSSFASATYPDGEIVAASSRRPEHRQWLSSHWPNIAIVDDATKVAELADLIFITTSDAAINPVCDSIPWQPHHHVIHCSGALTLSVLEAAANAGASVAGFHPLQTFPGYGDPDRLSNIAYAIDCNDEALTAWLQSFADAPTTATPSESKAKPPTPHTTHPPSWHVDSSPDSSASPPNYGNTPASTANAL